VWEREKRFKTFLPLNTGLSKGKKFLYTIFGQIPFPMEWEAGKG
jgi:hypothetical protein